MYTWRELYELLALSIGTDPGELRNSYNVAPTQLSPIVQSGPAVVFAEWGFRPAWSASPVAPINARAESAATSPLFRAAFKSRRCVVPVSGFYEWKKLAGGKQPLYIRRADRRIMLLAGLWEPQEDRIKAEPASGPASEARKPGARRGSSRADDGPMLWSEAGEPVATPGPPAAKPKRPSARANFTILTTEPNEFMRTIHTRMPAILEPSDALRWLGEPDGGLLVPAPDGLLDAYPISTRVNAPRNNDPSLLDPAA